MEKGEGMLTDLITEETVQIIDKKVNWKEAFEILAAPLVKNGSIEPRYIDAMINRIEELGPFINLGKGIAIPHARPEDGVTKKAMGLLVLKEPIYLLDRDDQKIDVLFLIAATDNESHLEALQELTIFLRDDENISKLKKIENYSDFKNIVSEAKGE
ncbi:PTS sugar transporter subunit IIA [Aerococcus urinae]|nr:MULTISPECIES: PTS sugar transporter subunit IIA [Aerococcus]KAA9290296.1 PTS sugar transporter subunit IIA [Aerococcus mictus]MDK6291790.1 PTS sugar transporter subunit IIA [Aerococcus urinae]MDK6450319.1 PTS sugar transporter subunit IIA [Aerococcus urinae]MDK6474335.1 PTS sugar transporter subunit IIA [Aerococcus urinae]MDK6597943.1 PTS sugar transporter subunit IIA [Aerococcus urinae]